MTPTIKTDDSVPLTTLQAEQALLGALLADNRTYDQVSGHLAPECFADPIHAHIFQTIALRLKVGQPADVGTLKGEFEHSGVLEEVGGTAYLARLLSSMVGIIDAREYGRAVHDSWLRRQLIDVGEAMIAAAFNANSETDAAGQIEATIQRLGRLGQSPARM
jgi:replicative DNA helicase